MGQTVSQYNYSQNIKLNKLSHEEIATKSNSSKSNTELNQKSNSIYLHKNCFCFKLLIGRGCYGNVWKVINLKTKRSYAIKIISKAKVLEYSSEESILFENSFLRSVHHP
jgi:hypothetical protein